MPGPLPEQPGPPAPRNASGTSSPTTQAPQPKPPDEPPGLALRAALLVVVVAAAGAWATHHLGWPLRLPAALTATLAFGAGVVNWLLDKSVLETARSNMRAWFRRRLTWPVVLAPALVVLLLSAFVSTITVQPETPGDEVQVRVAPAGAEATGGTGSDVHARQLDGDRTVARFVYVVPPWGRSFVVDSDGYAPGTFEVFPVLSRTVRLARDLPPVPAVLFRPGADGLSLLGDGAVFTVWHVGDDDRRQLVATDSSGRQASFLVGRRRALPDSLATRWRADIAEHMGAAAADRFIRAWAEPVAVEPLHEPPPSGRLVAEIDLHGTLVSRGEVRLGTGRLLDVPMIDVLLNPGGIP